MMPAHNDTEVTLEFGEEHEFQPKKTLRHPVAVFFHLTFRILAIATYIFCGWFSSSFILCFVIIVLLLSMDFWTVKNITGRLLVGLRWWNQIDDDGQSRWVYESRKGAEKGLVRSAESRIFWLSLVVTEVCWCIFLFSSIFTFSLKWLMVVLVGIILNGANLYGYVRCKVGSKESVKTAATSFLSKQMFTSMFQTMTASSSSPNTQSS